RRRELLRVWRRAWAYRDQASHFRLLSFMPGTSWCQSNADVMGGSPAGSVSRISIRLHSFALQGVGRRTQYGALEGGAGPPGDPLSVFDGLEAGAGAHLHVHDLIRRRGRDVDAGAKVGHQEELV